VNGADLRKEHNEQLRPAGPKQRYKGMAPDCCAVDLYEVANILALGMWTLAEGSPQGRGTMTKERVTCC
jgi:hypothetical protein